jgi:integrase
MAIYKDEKRNTWYFRVYVEDKVGNQKQKSRSGFRTKSEAKEEELKFLSESKRDYSDLTFQELYNIFIKSKKQNLKFQSIRSIISRYSTHILPYFKDYKVNKIDNKVYLEWKEWILGKGFTYKYNSNLHGSMVAILNYAMDFYDLEKNIASKVGNFARKDYIEKVDFWTYEEFTQFIKYVDDDLYSVLFKTLYYTGMRLGECLALNWTNIKDNYIDVRKTLARGKNDNHYTITKPKTRKSIRQIKLDDETINILEKLKVFYKTYVGFNEEWFVFGGLYPLSQTTIGRKKDEYCKKANVKRIKIHDLRHSHATLLLSRGVPITVISKRLGHADITMTLNTYSHLIPEDEDKAINLINDLNKKSQVSLEGLQLPNSSNLDNNIILQNQEKINKQENFERIQKVGTKKSL